MRDQEQYFFDGKIMSWCEIRKAIPMIKRREQLHRELSAGRNTRAAVLCHRPRTHRGGFKTLDYRSHA